MKGIKKIKENIQNNKVLSIILKIIKVLVYIFVCLLLLIIVVQRVTNNNFAVGGFRVFTVISESMKGEYEIGDMLISKATPKEDINIGDNVTYHGEKGDMKGLVVTHKVISKREENGITYFTTKGIANSIEDPEIEYSQIYGKVIYKATILSFMIKLLNSNVVYYLVFILVGIIVSYEVVSSIFEAKSEDDDDGKEE